MKLMLKYFVFTLLSLYPITSYGIEIDGIEYSLDMTSHTAGVVARKDSQKYSGDIVIPKTIVYDEVEYTVTSVSGFSDSNGLISVILPQTVVTLGTILRNCVNLRSVTIPGVKSIDQTNFMGCSSLESITFGESISSFSSYAFKDCSNLKSVFVPNLDTWLHVKCSYVKNANTSLKTNEVSSPLIHGADLYINGEKLVNLVIPEDVTSISLFNFYGCTSIKEITIEGELTIGQGAFENCKNLQKLTIKGDCVLEKGCFSMCTSLTQVVFNGSIDYFSAVLNGELPFNNCNNIKSIYLPRNLAEEHAGTKRLYEGAGYYYRDYRVGYLSDLFPTVEEITVQEGTMTIGNGKFSNCTSLKTISIPNSVLEIGDRAFSGCTMLTDIKIPENVTCIGEASFSNCSSITSINIPENVVQIKSFAFRNCQNLKYVHLADSHIAFGWPVFSDCENLTTAGPYHSNCSIEYGWTKVIPDYAFYDINNLQTVIIPSTIESIGNYAFGVSPIQSIYIDAAIPPSVSPSTFFYYSATVYVPRDCKEVYSNAPYWKDFNIVELVDVESIEIAKDRYDIIVGESKEIEVTILPDNATYKDLYWSVDNLEIARIDSGDVVGVKTGITKITATTTDGTNLSASCLISVTNPVLTVSLSKDQVELEVEDTETITANCSPSDADDTSISWHSSNTNVAMVDNGIIKAVAVGETKITATAVNGVEANCKVVVTPTIATALTLNTHSLQLTTGKTETIETNILPSRTTNKMVAWSSSDSKIASVDDSGTIRALSNGTVTITATTTDGSNLSDKCIVSVTTLATDISLSKDNANLIVGQSLPVNATVYPLETSNKNITWQSNNSNCATVDSDGTVNAIATGTATITATTTDGTNLSASCVVIVTNPVISLTLDKTSAELMVGQQIEITASCIPSNADNTTITWSSSNTDIASVDKGVVIAKKLGTAVITASSANGIEAKCIINVVPTPITSLSLNESSIAIVKDKIFALECTIVPDDATNKELIWHSLNDKIAKVSEDGIVTGISTGETTIIVEAKSNSKISASCKVKVTTPITALKLEQTTQELYVEDGMQLSAECTPTDADNTQLEWISSDDNVASVSGDGYVTTRNEGNVRITATTTDGTNLSASCDIIVKKRKQTISWSQDVSYFHNGGEMFALEATSSSALPVTFTSSDENVISIFDLGDVVYANPVNRGTAYISAFQEGNYKYEPVEVKKKIEVEGTPITTSKTLVVYYSHSPIIDGIVAELANQIAASNVSVKLQKIEPVSSRINEANCDNEVRDSVMNIISLYPNEPSSYPEIKTINVNINDYDNIIMVYPLWNALMAAPIQTFNFYYKDILEKKSNAYIEYDLFDETDSSSNAKVLRFNSSNIEDMSNVIEGWLNNFEATGILHLYGDKKIPTIGIHDLQGRKLQSMPNEGVFIINGNKTVINHGRLNRSTTGRDN